MKIVNIFISIVFLMLLISGSFWIYRFFYGEQSNVIIVPDIVGMDIYTAKENLKLVGLEIEVVSSSFSDKPLNTIIKQYPEAGSEVKQKSIIKVVVSKGEKEDLENVPDMIGKKIDEILTNPLVNMFIKRYNITLDFIYYPSLLMEDKKVILQVPPTGFPKNKKISLLISKKINPYELKRYSELSDFLYNANFDAFLVNLNNTNLNEDRKIENIEINDKSVVVNSILNYNQIPAFKMTTIYIKVPYSANISFIEVFLSDFLGTRCMLKQYYTGYFASNFLISYLGEGKIVVKVNKKTVSNYELP